jgi:pyruvate dehydrogenase E2 component (dihydrolipoamide acetyltransferase)
MLVFVAVAVEDGLVVPVLKFTDAMSLSQIGGSVRDLAGRANKKIITNRNGSTFTVSNLGMFGIVEFNSIINQPAILSVGSHCGKTSSEKRPNCCRKHYDVIFGMRPPYC